MTCAEGMRNRSSRGDSTRLRAGLESCRPNNWSFFRSEAAATTEMMSLMAVIVGLLLLVFT